jgi:hypothetical protein
MSAEEAIRIANEAQTSAEQAQKEANKALGK